MNEKVTGKARRRGLSPINAFRDRQTENGLPASPAGGRYDSQIDGHTSSRIQRVHKTGSARLKSCSALTETEILHADQP